MSYREDVYERYPENCGRGTGEPTKEPGPYLRQLVRRHFPEERADSVVDLGCGGGALLAEALRAGFKDVRGADRSPQQVAGARARGLSGVELADLHPYVRSLESASVGVLVTMDVLEHLGRDEALTLAREARRVLKSGGRWLIHVPNGESPFCGRIRYGDLTHETAYTTSSLAQLLRVSGFRRFSFHEDRPTIHGPASLLRHVAWRAIRTMLRIVLFIETGNTGREAILSQGLLAVAEAD